MKLYVSLFYLFFLIQVVSFGQGQAITNSGLAGPNASFNLPEDFQISNANNEEVEFYQLNFRTPTIDLRKLREVSGYQIEDAVVITPPDLSSFDHTTVLIGLYGETDDPKMVIWLAGNYNYRRATYFVDQNQDRDFTNDEEPIHFDSKKGAQNIVMNIDGKVETFFIAHYQKEQQIKPTSPIDALSLSIFGGVGVGSIDYGYQDNTIGFPASYDVRFVEKNIGVAIAYDLPKFSFGFTSSLQNNFYYTSTLVQRLGDPYFFDPTGGNITRNSTDPAAGGARVYVENIEVNNNLDRQVANKLQLSFYGVYKFNLSQKFIVQPLVRFGMTNFIGEGYKRDRNSADTFELKNGTFYEFGIRAEVLIGIARSIYLEVLMNSYQWEPQDFLAEVPHSNFSSSASLLKANIGYRFGL